MSLLLGSNVGCDNSLESEGALDAETEFLSATINKKECVDVKILCSCINRYRYRLV
jgi:hypothetical protein